MTIGAAAGQFARWRAAVEAALCRPAVVLARQHRRYQFGYWLGQLLTEPVRPGSQPAEGHVLYGVAIAGAGLVYVGQSANARRRLRDLPVGESHHLATTIPPEAWTKVLVVQWPALLDTIPPGEARTASGLGSDTCSLALEYHLHLPAGRS